MHASLLHENEKLGLRNIVPSSSHKEILINNCGDAEKLNYGLNSGIFEFVQTTRNISVMPPDKELIIMLRGLADGLYTCLEKSVEYYEDDTVKQFNASLNQLVSVLVVSGIGLILIVVFALNRLIRRCEYAINCEVKLPKLMGRSDTGFTFT